MQATLYKTREEFISDILRIGKGSIISLDLGAKKVGVAKADLSLKIAVPLTIVHYKNIRSLSSELLKIISENSVIGIVVGLPSHSDMETMKKEVIAFVDALNLGLPFVLEDESYTTKMANTLLTDAGLNRKKRNAIDDKISAKIILDSFLTSL